MEGAQVQMKVTPTMEVTTAATVREEAVLMEVRAGMIRGLDPPVGAAEEGVNVSSTLRLLIALFFLIHPVSRTQADFRTKPSLIYE